MVFNNMTSKKVFFGKKKQEQEEKTLQEFQRIRNSYLELMHSCLTGSIYHDTPIHLNNITEYNDELREYGWDWPSVAHTMIGRKRLENVRNLVESVIGNNVAGDFIETGVWRGGACIMMRAVLNAYRVTDRKVWLADSFEGLPPPNIDDYPEDKGDTFHEFSELAVSIDEVKQNFEKYGLLDEQVGFIKGWFKDTLPAISIDKLALIRLDGDMYESTIQPLNTLYDKLSIEGYVIVDDYHVVKGCKLAVHDFFLKKEISPTLMEIDGVGVYWKKEQ
jgi:hypothetical protein